MRLTRYVHDSYGGKSVTVDPAIRTVSMQVNTACAVMLPATFEVELVEDIEILPDLEICEPWKILTGLKAEYGEGTIYSSARSYKTVSRISALRVINTHRMIYMMSENRDVYSQAILDQVEHKMRGAENIWIRTNSKA